MEKEEVRKEFEGNLSKYALARRIITDSVNLSATEKSIMTMEEAATYMQDFEESTLGDVKTIINRMLEEDSEESVCYWGEYLNKLTEFLYFKSFRSKTILERYHESVMQHMKAFEEATQSLKEHLKKDTPNALATVVGIKNIGQNLNMRLNNYVKSACDTERFFQGYDSSTRSRK